MKLMRISKWTTVLFFVIQVWTFFAQDTLIENRLPARFALLEKYNTPVLFKFDSVTVYAICTGFISTGKQFPEPVFVWLIKTSGGNYLVDAGLPPGINSPGFFKGFSGSFFSRKFDCFVYKENDLTYQLTKLGLITDLQLVVLTHGHFDHIGYLNRFSNTPRVISVTEKNQIKNLGQFAGYMKGTKRRIDFTRARPVKSGTWEIKRINRYLSVIRTGNHTKGHMMVLLEAGEKEILFTGDVNVSTLNKKSGLYRFLNASIKLDTARLFFNHDVELVP